ncbi:MAG: glycosyltransferase family 4 protein [Deferribacteraceae bacterium]|nr:glycosyltransferase family 4 protein [Deferribacteraceae bacterium]
MKIAFLSHLDLNLFLFRLPIMKELVNLNHKVYAVIPKGEYFEKFKDFGIISFEYKIKRSSLNPFNEISTILNIQNIIKKINPDILHTFMHKPNIYGNLSGTKNIINTVTGLGSFFVHNDQKSKMVRYAIENLYRITTKFSKKVVFQNSDDMAYFIKKGIIKEDKAVLIKSSGVDTDYFKPEPKDEELTRELKINKNKPIVLMIARVIKDKGVEEYIRATEILKNKANFLYVGDVDKGNKNAFVPDWKDVKYLGFRKDIKQLISICDVFVLPSYREGIPRTLLEAAAMGKPIVTTDAVGCREVVENNKNGFLVPIKDHVKLAKKIEILINNNELRERFGKYSREKAVKEFDIKLVVSQYIKLYEELLNV